MLDTPVPVFVFPGPVPAKPGPVTSHRLPCVRVHIRIADLAGLSDRGTSLVPTITRLLEHTGITLKTSPSKGEATLDSVLVRESIYMGNTLEKPVENPRQMPLF